jgi:hypothetical protein
MDHQTGPMIRAAGAVPPVTTSHVRTKHFVIRAALGTRSLAHELDASALAIALLLARGPWPLVDARCVD